MLKENTDQNKLQEAIPQQPLQEDKKLAKQEVKKGCGCKNKLPKFSKERKLQDLHEKMKKTKYL